MQKTLGFSGPCYLKMLFNDATAGSFIGKKGAIITWLQTQTGCTIKLSPNNHYFPGTKNRIVIISGELDRIKDVVTTALEKSALTNSGYFKYATNSPIATEETESSTKESEESANHINTPFMNRRFSIKIVIPKSSVSAIIGKGGHEVKALQSKTNTKIQVSGREERLSERVVNIFGLLEDIKTATFQIIDTIQNDSNLKSQMNVFYKHSDAQYEQLNSANVLQSDQNYPLKAISGTPYNCDTINMAWHQMKSEPDPNFLNQLCEVLLVLPIFVVNMMFGGQNSIFTDIQNMTGVEFRLFHQGDIFSGTPDLCKTVILRGSIAAVHYAHIMILKHINTFQKQIVQPEGLIEHFMPISGNLNTAYQDIPITSGTLPLNQVVYYPQQSYL